jgi:hypothetical protein
MRPADHDRSGAKRQRLDDVDSAPEAAVDEHRRLAADRADHAEKRADRGDRAVDWRPP